MASCCRVVVRVQHSCAPYAKEGYISHTGLSCPLQMRLAVFAVAEEENIRGLCSILAVPALRLLNTRLLGVEHSAMTSGSQETLWTHSSCLCFRRTGLDYSVLW